MVRSTGWISRASNSHGPGWVRSAGGTLRVDVDHLTRSCRRQRLENGRHERLQISKSIGGGVQDHDRSVTYPVMRRLASSKKAITCLRVTVGKPSRNSSIVSPASM